MLAPACVALCLAAEGGVRGTFACVLALLSVTWRCSTCRLCSLRFTTVLFFSPEITASQHAAPSMQHPRLQYPAESTIHTGGRVQAPMRHRARAGTSHTSPGTKHLPHERAHVGPPCSSQHSTAAAPLPATAASAPAAKKQPKAQHRCATPCACATAAAGPTHPPPHSYPLQRTCATGGHA